MEREECRSHEDSWGEILAWTFGFIIIVLSFVIYYKNDTIHDLKTPPMPPVPEAGTEIVCGTDGINV